MSRDYSYFDSEIMSEHLRPVYLALRQIQEKSDSETKALLENIMTWMQVNLHGIVIGAASEWIEETQKPPAWLPVLVRVRHGHYANFETIVAAWVPRSGWRFTVKLQTPEVTHWMHLPQKPAGETWP